MAKIVPRTYQLGACPLTGPRHARARPRHLVWKDPTGWITAFGTPDEWLLIASGLPCWHFAIDCITRWDQDPGHPENAGGWISPALRPNTGLELPDGQTVCDICHTDLTGSRT